MGADDDTPTRPVSSLRARFEALSSGASAAGPSQAAPVASPRLRVPSARPRGLSSPPTPTSEAPVPTLRLSPSHGALRADRPDSYPSTSTASSDDGSRPTTPPHDGTPLVPAEATRPAPSPSGKGPPPPVPPSRRRSASPSPSSVVEGLAPLPDFERRGSVVSIKRGPSGLSTSKPPSRRPSYDVEAVVSSGLVGPPPPRATPTRSSTSDLPALLGPRPPPTLPPPRRGSPAPVSVDVPPIASTSAPPTLPARGRADSVDLDPHSDYVSPSTSPRAVGHMRLAPPLPRTAIDGARPHPSAPPRPAIDRDRSSTAPSRPDIPPRPSISSPAGSPSDVSAPRPIVPPRPVPPPPPGHPRRSTLSEGVGPSSAPARIQPPPPRHFAADARLAPIRPQSVAGSGVSGDESDDGTDDDPAAALADLLPDATFASRRPPVLQPTSLSVTSKVPFACSVVRGDSVALGVGSSVRLQVLGNPAGDLAIPLPGEARVVAMAFRAGAPVDEARYLWIATKDGTLAEIDLREGRVTDTHAKAHAHSVTHIFTVDRPVPTMLTLDEGGKLQIWAAPSEDGVPSLVGLPRTQRITMERDRSTPAVGLLDGQQAELWVASGAANLSGSSSIRVYAPLGLGAFTLTTRPVAALDACGRLGSPTSIAVVDDFATEAVIAHENGRISIWSRESYACLRVVDLGQPHVTSLIGAGYSLWVGFRSGHVRVYDLRPQPWSVLKEWRAHAEPITSLSIDPTSLWTHARLHLITSSGHDQSVRFWDAFCELDWIDKHMAQREADYCAFRPLSVLLCSWNLSAQRPAALTGPDNAGFLAEVLGSTGETTPDVIVFGFQEIIDLDNKKTTAKTMLLGKSKKDGFADGISHAYRLWHDHLVQAVRLHMPPDCPYVVTHTENLVGLFTCVFAKTAERSRLRDIAVTTVKTGLGGRYGNKGAIAARLVCDDSSICFINCHLAAGQSHRKQRIKDLIEILETKGSFEDALPTVVDAYVGGGDGAMVSDHDVTILSGDLNFRIDVRRDLAIKQAYAYELEPLLQQDQLLKEMKLPASRMRYFREGQITFPPTYKYDRGTTQYDSSEKNRIPAWCDRVLWRTNVADKVVQTSYRRYETTVSDHRPISASFEIRIKSIVPDRRDAVLRTVEAEWPTVQRSRLEAAKAIYGPLIRV